MMCVRGCGERVARVRECVRVCACACPLVRWSKHGLRAVTVVVRMWLQSGPHRSVVCVCVCVCVIDRESSMGVCGGVSARVRWCGGRHTIHLGGYDVMIYIYTFLHV